MSTQLASSPVAEAVLALLVADQTLVDLAVGGIHDELPQDPPFPCVWCEYLTEIDRRGLGLGTLPEIALRVHVFSAYGGRREGQAVLDRVIALLKDAALAVTGWTQAGLVFYDSAVSLPAEALDGVKVHELVANFRIYVEA